MLALARSVVLALLPAALTAQGERAPESFQLAVGLQQRGLHDEAARHYESFLAKEPKHRLAAEAHYRLGLCQIELQRRDQAIASLTQAAKLGGKDFALLPECRYRLGGLLAQGGDHAAAAAQFEALAQSVPPDHYLLAAAWFAAGEARRELGAEPAAVAAFTAAAAAAEGGERAAYRFPALYQLGFAQLRSQQLAAAAATFTSAAGAAADAAAKAECHYLVGDTLLRLQEWDAAAAAFARVDKLGGEFADDACLGLGFVQVGRGDGKAAALAFGALLERFPDSPHRGLARLEMGRALVQTQQAAPAEAALQPLLAEGVDAALQRQARELLGLSALASGAGERAVAALQRSLADAEPAERPRLAYALGEALASVQRWQEAVAAYGAVPASSPPELRGDAAYGAGFALHALGRFEESLAQVEVVLAIEPPHRLAVEARLAVAENLFALRRYQDAMPHYRALTAGPHRGTAAWKLAWCEYLAGDKRTAGSAFAAIAKDEGPHQEEALAMQALALLEAGDDDAALQAADRYRVRHQNGAFLDRTERTAARVLKRRGDLAAAQQRLQRAAEASRQRGSAEAIADALEQAELAYQQGDFRNAATGYQALADRDDATGARAVAGLAWCAFELGDHAGCAAAIERALAHGHADAERCGLRELAVALAHRQQDWPAAIAAAETFLREHGQSAAAPSVTFALGTALARAGDHARAAKVLGELATAGGHARMDRVHYELAWAHRRAGDEAAALAAFAVVQASDDVELCGEARLHLGTAALLQGELPKATELLLAVQGSHRERALYALASAEFAAAAAAPEALGRALPHFRAVIAVSGEHAGEARFFAAECERALGRPGPALELLRELLAAEPKHARAPAARLRLGELAVLTEQPALGIPALQEFLAAEDVPIVDRARANLWLGRARMAQRDHDAAEANFVVVTETSDGELAAEAQFRLGENRRARGDLRGAVDAFVKLPILYGHPRWVRQGLLQAGRTYEQLGQKDKAARFYDELRTQHPDSDEARALDGSASEPGKQGGTEKPEKPEKPAKSEKSEKSGKSEKSEQKDAR